jgi:hypothetical protein
MRSDGRRAVVGGTRARRGRLALGGAATLLALGACGVVSRPQSHPSGRQGTLLYTVGRLSFEAPAAWDASGDARRVLLVGPGTEGRLDARQVDRKFADVAQCLADAEAALQRGGERLTGVRRHPSTLAGRKAVFQEADHDRWHGWAWAVCDHGEQYRVFLTAPAPVGDATIRAMRLVSSSATLGAR